jgi:hypothetical protein
MHVSVCFSLCIINSQKDLLACLTTPVETALQWALPNCKVLLPHITMQMVSEIPGMFTHYSVTEGGFSENSFYRQNSSKNKQAKTYYFPVKRALFFPSGNTPIPVYLRTYLLSSSTIVFLDNSFIL